LNKTPNFEEIDGIAVLTEWNEFKNFDYGNASVFDGRNILNEASYSIGKQIISQK
jgi:UDP-glucose 6-dehydrogenase